MLKNDIPLVINPETVLVSSLRGGRSSDMIHSIQASTTEAAIQVERISDSQRPNLC